MEPGKVGLGGPLGDAGPGRDSGLALATRLLVTGAAPKRSPCLIVLCMWSSWMACSRVAESRLDQVQFSTSQSSLSVMMKKSMRVA